MNLTETTSAFAINANSIVCDVPGANLGVGFGNQIVISVLLQNAVNVPLTPYVLTLTWDNGGGFALLDPIATFNDSILFVLGASFGGFSPAYTFTIALPAGMSADIIVVASGYLDTQASLGGDEVIGRNPIFDVALNTAPNFGFYEAVFMTVVVESGATINTPPDWQLVSTHTQGALDLITLRRDISPWIRTDMMSPESFSTSAVEALWVYQPRKRGVRFPPPINITMNKGETLSLPVGIDWGECYGPLTLIGESITSALPSITLSPNPVDTINNQVIATISMPSDIPFGTYNFTINSSNGFGVENLALITVTIASFTPGSGRYRIRVANPDQSPSTNPRVVYDYSTTHIAEITKIRLTGYGDVIEARFKAIPRDVDIRYQDKVQILLEDSAGNFQPVVWGCVITDFDPSLETLQEYVIAGGLYILDGEHVSLSIPDLTDIGSVGYAIAAQAVGRLPAGVLSTAPGAFDNAGIVTTLKPGTIFQAAQLLAEVAKIVNDPLYQPRVNGVGEVQMKFWSGILRVVDDTIARGELPRDSKDIVTRAIVVLLSGIPEDAKSYKSTVVIDVAGTPTPVNFPPEPLPTTIEAQSLAHAIYKRTKLVAPPEGANAFYYAEKTGIAVTASSGFSSVGGLYDSLLPSAKNQTGQQNPTAIFTKAELWYGFQVRYRLKQGSVKITLSRGDINPSVLNSAWDEALYILEPTGDTFATVDFFTPIDGRAIGLRSTVIVEGVGVGSAAGDLDIRVRPYVLSAALNDYAKSLLQVPVQTPGDIIMPGFVAPVPWFEVRDNSLTGPLLGEGLIPEWTITLTVDEISSRANLGQARISAEARAIGSALDRVLTNSKFAVLYTPNRARGGI